MAGRARSHPRNRRAGRAVAGLRRRWVRRRRPLGLGPRRHGGPSGDRCRCRRPGRLRRRRQPRRVERSRGWRGGARGGFSRRGGCGRGLGRRGQRRWWLGRRRERGWWLRGRGLGRRGLGRRGLRGRGIRGSRLRRRRLPGGRLDRRRGTRIGRSRRRCTGRGVGRDRRRYPVPGGAAGLGLAAVRCDRRDPPRLRGGRGLVQMVDSPGHRARPGPAAPAGPGWDRC